jgi:hypothetical protein
MNWVKKLFKIKKNRNVLYVIHNQRELLIGFCDFIADENANVDGSYRDEWIDKYLSNIIANKRQ